MTSPNPASDVPDPLAADRTDYLDGQLGDDAPADPFAVLAGWMGQARARHAEHRDLPDATAVVLSTLHRETDGTLRPRSRTVLLKGSGPEGFVVFTNRESAKGREIAAEPQVSLLLPWYALQRQVRIEGRAELLDDAASDAYFASRPRGSQLAAWASEQSAEVAGRDALDARYAEVEQRFAGAEVPRPPFWGGYRIVPDRIEFWQGRGHRLHDRLLYERGADAAWTRRRLQP